MSALQIKTRNGVHPETETIWIEDGEEVFPCSCGRTHRGPYGWYDRHYHECRGWHEAVRIDIDDMDDPLYICTGCGQVVEIRKGWGDTT